MSDFNIPDNAFDDGFDPGKVESHNETVAFVRFGKLCLLPGLSVEKVFEAGTRLEFPGITGTTFEKGQIAESNGEPFSLPVLKIKGGSRNKLYTMILRETTTEGNEWDNIFRFKNWNEVLQERELDTNGLPVLNDNGKANYQKIKGDDGKYLNERNAFLDFQAPELEELKKRDPAGYAKLQYTGRALFSGDNDKAWVFIKAYIEDTSYTKGFEVRSYLKDIQIFNSKEEWEKAKGDQIFNTLFDKYDHYPKAWASAPIALQEAVRKAKDKPVPVIIRENMIEGEAINGQPVDAEALVKEILGLPF